MTEAVDHPTEHDATEHDEGDLAADASSSAETRAANVEHADAAPATEIDVAAIEADLDGVQAALTRLADGTYWTDEVTGDAIPADVLAADPLARRA